MDWYQYSYNSHVNMSNREHYEEGAARLASEIKLLKRRSRGYVGAEIVFFLAAVGFVVLYTVVQWGWVLLAAAALWLAGYFVVRWLDVRNDRTIARKEDLRSVFVHELEALEGNFSSFNDGSRFANPHHPFAVDLDVFGPDSLYQRMNRCVTSGGAQLLAGYLSLECAVCQPEAICHLGHDAGFMDHFQALGQRGQADTEAIRKATEALCGVRVPRWLGSWAARAAAVLLLAGFCAVVVLAFAGRVSVGVPIAWGVVQFYLVFLLCHPYIRRISKSAGSLQRHVGLYVKLVQLCRQKTDWPEGLKADVAELEAASGSFEQLEQLMAAIDRRGNEFGLLVTNVCYLGDFFIVRRFLHWRAALAQGSGRWMQAMSHVDALVSAGRFACNHPEACTAEIAEGDGVTYRARGIWHPFIGKDAVRNDFEIADTHYYIVTGANMAGKSTFLRAIGINYVLAMNGMPVFAEQLQVSRFNLFSSMRTTDDLTHGISYFNAELLRLRQLIGFCKTGGRQPAAGSNGSMRSTLIILDEILKGTNSLDKLNGSRLFLESIAKLPVSGLIATHDLELSRMGDERPDRFHNYCFEIELGTQVTYSYKITPGVARNQNATFLLRDVLKNVE